MSAISAVLAQLGIEAGKSAMMMAQAPVMALVQVVIPVALVSVVTVVHKGTPPVVKPSCFYSARSLPSEGSLVNMQSLMCNINQTCQKNESAVSSAEENAKERFAALQSTMDSFVQNNTKFKSLTNLKKSIEAMNVVSKVVRDTSDQATKLDFNLTIGRFFSDHTKVINYLVNETGMFSTNTARDFLRGNININKMISNPPQTNNGKKQPSCDSAFLGQIINVTHELTLHDIAKAFCPSNGTNKMMNESFLMLIDLYEVIRLFHDYATMTSDSKLSHEVKNIANFVKFLGTFDIKEYFDETVYQIISSWFGKLIAKSTKSLNLDAIYKNVKDMQNIMLAMDPLLSSSGLISPLSLKILNNGLSESLEIMDLVKKAGHPHPEFNMSFSLFFNRSKEIMDYLSRYIPKSAESWTEVFAASVRPTGAKDFIEKWLVGKSLKQLLCDSPGLVSLVCTKPTTSKSCPDYMIVKQAQDLVCLSDSPESSKVFQMMTNSFNISRAGDEIHKRTNSTMKMDEWVTLLKLMQNSSNLFSFMNDTNEIFEFVENVRRTLQHLTHLLKSDADIMDFLTGFGSTMDFVESTGILQNETLSIYQTVKVAASGVRVGFKKAEESMNLISNAFKHDFDLRKYLQRIVHSTNHSSTMSGIDIAELLSLLMQTSTEDFMSEFCNSTSMFTNIFTPKKLLCDTEGVASIWKLKKMITIHLMNMSHSEFLTSLNSSKVSETKFWTTIINDLKNAAQKLEVQIKGLSSELTGIFGNSSYISSASNLSTPIIESIILETFTQTLEHLDNSSMNTSTWWLTLRSQVLMTHQIMNMTAKFLETAEALSQEDLLEMTKLYDLPKLLIQIPSALPTIIKIAPSIWSSRVYLLTMMQNNSFCRNYTFYDLISRITADTTALKPLSDTVCHILIKSDSFGKNWTRQFEQVFRLLTNVSMISNVSSWRNITKDFHTFYRTIYKKPQMMVSNFIDYFQKNLTMNISSASFENITSLEQAIHLLDEMMKIVETLWGTDKSWNTFKYSLHMVHLFANLTNTRISMGLAHPESLFAEHGKLQILQNSFFNVLPDLLRHLRPQLLLTIPDLVKRKMPAGSFCVNFKLSDLLPTAFHSSSITNFENALCSVLPDITKEQEEITNLINALTSNKTMSTKINISAMISTFNQTIHLWTELYTTTAKTISNASKVMEALANRTFPELLMLWNSSMADRSLLMNILDVAASFTGSSKEWKNATALLSTYAAFLNNYFEGIGGISTLPKGSSVTGNVGRIIDLFNEYPTILNHVLNSSIDLLNNPEKFKSWQKHLLNVCKDAEAFEFIFNLAPSSTEGQRLRSLICSLKNISAGASTDVLPVELMKLVPETSKFLFTVFTNITSAITGNSLKELPGIVSSFIPMWTKVLEELQALHTHIDPRNLNKTILLTNLGPHLMRLKQMFVDTPVTQVLDRYFRSMATILNMEGIKLDSSTSLAIDRLRNLTEILATLSMGGVEKIIGEFNETQGGRDLLAAIKDIDSFLKALQAEISRNPSKLTDLGQELLTKNVTVTKFLCSKFLTEGFWLTEDPEMIEKAKRFLSKVCPLNIDAIVPKSLRQILALVFPPNMSFSNISKVTVAKLLMDVTKYEKDLMRIVRGDTTTKIIWQNLHTLLQTFNASTLNITLHGVFKMFDLYLLMLTNSSMAESIHKELWTVANISKLVTEELKSMKFKNITGESLFGKDLGPMISHLANLTKADVEKLLLSQINMTTLQALLRVDGLDHLLCTLGLGSIFIPRQSFPASVDRFLCTMNATTKRSLKEILISANVTKKLIEKTVDGPEVFFELVPQLMKLKTLLGMNSTISNQFFEEVMNLANNLGRLNESGILEEMLKSPEWWAAYVDTVMKRYNVTIPISRDALAVALAIYQTAIGYPSEPKRFNISTVIPHDIFDKILDAVRRETLQKELELLVYNPIGFITMKDPTSTLCDKGTYVKIFGSSLEHHHVVLCLTARKDRLVLFSLFKHYGLSHVNFSGEMETIRSVLLWTTDFISQFWKLKTDAEAFNRTRFPTIVQDILNISNSSSINIKDVLKPINETCGIIEPYLKPFLPNAISMQLSFLTDIVHELSTLLSGVPALSCDLMTMSFAKYPSTIMERMNTKKFEEILKSGPTKTFSCGSVTKFAHLIATNIQNGVMDYHKSRHCLLGVLTRLVHATDEILNLKNHSSKVASLTKLIPKEMKDMIELLPKSFDWSSEVAILFERFLGPSAISALAGNASISALELGRSIIRINATRESNMSQSDMKKAICSGDLIHTLFNLPPSIGISTKNLTQFLCSSFNSEFLEIASAVTRVALQSQSIPIDSSESDDKMIEFFNQTIDLLVSMKPMMNLTNIFRELNSSDVPGMMHRIERIPFEIPTDNIHAKASIVKKNINTISSFSIYNSYFTATEDIIKGMDGLKYVQKYLPLKVQIGKFFETKSPIYDFFENLKLNRAEVDALFNLNVSAVQIAHISQGKGIPFLLCGRSTVLPIKNEPVLAQPSVSGLCSKLSNEDLVEMIEYLSEHASIINYIKSDLTQGFGDKIKNAGSSIDEVKSVASNFNVMKDLESSLKSIVPDATSDTVKDDSNSTTSSAIGEAMCGSDKKMGLNTTSISASSRRRKRRSVAQTSTFCHDLLTNTNQSKSGQSITSFFNPLLNGKIIVTPDLPWVRQIIEKANETYKELADLKAVLSSMTETMTTFSSDSGSNLLNDVKGAMKNPMFASIMAASSGSTNMSAVVNQLQTMIAGKEMKRMQFYLEMMRNFTSCLPTDRFEFYKDESDKKYNRLILNHIENRIYAAINFMNSTEDPDTVPLHVSYTIRMSNWLSQPTIRLYKGTFPQRRPDFVKDLKYSQGFIQIQENIDKAIIAVQTGKGLKQQPKVATRQFPQSCTKEDRFMLLVGQHFVPVMILLAWLQVLLSSVSDALMEREYNLEKALYVMGRKPSLRWITWFLSHMVSCLILTIIMTLSLKLGGVLSEIGGFLIFITFLIYSLSVLMFGYFISSLFDSSSLALLCTIVLYLISYVPYAMATEQTIGIPATVVKISMIFPVVPMAVISQYWGSYQVAGLPFHFPDMLKNYAILSPACCIGVLIADAVLYFILGWYIRNAFAGSRGIVRSPLFFLTKLYWGIDDESESIYTLASARTKDEFAADICENIYSELGSKRNSTGSTTKSSDDHIAVKICNLMKTFKNCAKPAVNNVSFDLRQNEITVLLGQNGAGKSTLISMILGLLKPSSGTITIGGLDREKNYHALRKKIGFCPQNDVFYPNLSVKENVSYFTSIKASNLSKKEQKMAVNEVLIQMDLKAFAKLRAKKLSGGQKRRLSIAIAFIGNSDLVILDEPTSGVDPASRRAIWNLISSQKENRTVVLCTHHIDEAETIGDRIAVLKNSELVAYDTPKHLRQAFGSRYNLSFKVDEKHENDSSIIIGDINRHLSTEKVETRGDHHSISINSGRVENNEIKSTLENVEMHAMKGVINSICLSFVSLENTFMEIIRSPTQYKANLKENAILEDLSITNDLKKESSRPDEKITSEGDRESFTVSDISRPEGSKSLLNRICALLKKQVLHTLRTWKTYVIQILLPCLFLALTLWSAKLLPNYLNSPPLILSPTIYGEDAMSFIKPLNSSINMSIMPIVEGPGIGTACMKDPGIMRYDLKCGDKIEVLNDPNMTKTEIDEYLNAPPCTCDIQKGRLNCPSKYSSVVPTKMIQIYSSDKIIILEPNKSTPVSEYLRVKSSYFTTDKTIIWGGWEFDVNNSIIVWFNTQGYHTLPSYYNALSNILLRGYMMTSRKMKLQETGDYGISTYTHPFPNNKDQYGSHDIGAKMADISLSLGVLISITLISASLCLRTLRERLTGEKFLLMLYGVSPVVYWIVNYLWDLGVCLLSLPIISGLLYASQNPYFSGDNCLATVILITFYLFASLPLCYLVARLTKSIGKGFFVNFLILNTLGFFLPMIIIINETMMPDKTAELNSYLENVFMIVPSASFGFGLAKIIRIEIIASFKRQAGLEVSRNVYGPDGLQFSLIFLIIESFAFFGLNLLLEVHSVRRFFQLFNLRHHLCKKSAATKYETSGASIFEDDIGVRNEQRRVTNQSRVEDPIIVRNLTKNYYVGKKTIKAVSDVTFGVAKGECVGLLGSNGAGKTSVFKCITGEISANKGNVEIKGQSVGLDVHTLGGSIGYCPQVDPLDPLLTVNETILLYCQLRGVSASDRSQQANHLQRALEIEDYRDVKVKHLSGGTRRKLSIAIALVGNPKVLLLDEPTSGVDVISKRRVWNLISAVKPNVSILLTSHSMEEMQVMGDKLAIMVNGKLHAFGSDLELKNNYGLSYHVQVWCDTFQSRRVSKKITEQFPGSTLKSRKGNLSEFAMPVYSLQLSQIFDILGKMKDENKINEFVVQNIKLEHIFLQMTSAQSEETIEEISNQGSMNKFPCQTIDFDPCTISSIKLQSNS